MTKMRLNKRSWVVLFASMTLVLVVAMFNDGIVPYSKYIHSKLTKGDEFSHKSFRLRLPHGWWIEEWDNKSALIVARVPDEKSEAVVLALVYFYDTEAGWKSFAEGGIQLLEPNLVGEPQLYVRESRNHSSDVRYDFFWAYPGLKVGVTALGLRMSDRHLVDELIGNIVWSRE